MREFLRRVAWSEFLRRVAWSAGLVCMVVGSLVILMALAVPGSQTGWEIAGGAAEAVVGWAIWRWVS